MKTMFDYNLTKEELEAMGFNSFMMCAHLNFAGSGKEVTKEIYLSHISEKNAFFDIAILLEYRGQDASEIWALIPELHQEYILGFDDVLIPV